jgi:dephospho-CoA kinase
MDCLTDGHRDETEACRPFLQVPDDEKQRKADIVIDTSKDENLTRIEVAELVHRLLHAQELASGTGE